MNGHRSYHAKFQEAPLAIACSWSGALGPLITFLANLYANQCSAGVRGSFVVAELLSWFAHHVHCFQPAQQSDAPRAFAPRGGSDKCSTPRKESPAGCRVVSMSQTYRPYRLLAELSTVVVQNEARHAI